MKDKVTKEQGIWISIIEYEYLLKNNTELANLNLDLQEKLLQTKKERKEVIKELKEIKRFAIRDEMAESLQELINQLSE